jgi:hypothetical protein
MSGNANKYTKFEYHLEDLDCEFCLYYDKKRKNKVLGCDRADCCCGDIRADAITDGRVIRDKGWNRRWAG